MSETEGNPRPASPGHQIRLPRYEASDPGPLDDARDGYTKGSPGLNTSTGKMFVNTDETAGAAVWMELAKAQHTHVEADITDLSHYTHPNHTGEVTSVGDGATTISDGVVTNAKLADMANGTIKGRATSGSGDPEDLTAAQVRSIINVEDGADVTDAANVQAAGAVMTSDIGSTVQAHDADLDQLAGLTAAQGDMIVGSSAPAWSTLALGNDGEMLRSDGTDLVYDQPMLAPLKPTYIHLATPDKLFRAIHTSSGGRPFAGIGIVANLSGTATMWMLWDMPYNWLPPGFLQLHIRAISSSTNNGKLNFNPRWNMITSLDVDTDQLNSEGDTQLDMGNLGDGLKGLFIYLNASTPIAAGPLLMQLDITPGGSNPPDQTVVMLTPRLIWTG